MKRIISLLLALCLAATFLSTAALADGFTDIEAGSYYEKAVYWAVANDITRGTTYSTFSPNEECTRGQMVTFLWRCAGSPKPSAIKAPFGDVAPSDYFFNAVYWALEHGITKGVSETEFAPNEPVTRGQTVTFLWRCAGSPKPADGGAAFTDVNPEEYYADAVLWAMQIQITNGMGDNTFLPDDSCTRGQIVTFLYRSAGEEKAVITSNITPLPTQTAGEKPTA